VVTRVVVLFASFDSATVFAGSTVAISVPALQAQVNDTDCPAARPEMEYVPTPVTTTMVAPAGAVPAFRTVMPSLLKKLTTRSGRGGGTIVHDHDASLAFPAASVPRTTKV